MFTSEVLTEATDLIERDGWWSNAHGGTGTDSACASNAISRVSIGAGLSDEEMLKAQHALSEHISGQRTILTIWKWNDAPERTQHEVVAAMRAAALIAAAREAQDAAFATYAQNVVSA